MTQSPPVRLKRRQRPPDLVLGPGTDTTALGKRPQVAGMEAESDREHEHDPRG
jgi:hypothetical protein